MHLNCYAFTPSPTSTTDSTVFFAYASTKAGSDLRKKGIIDETRKIDEHEGKGTVGQTRKWSACSKSARAPSGATEQSTPSRAELLQISNLKI
ncbi:hypothetical protein EZV62_006962 [Acer yangbiense]|uniref:Uncharacterized protein n=1 Tax=Acer yangbiense TaxID=1000413 RepID=A0A5C7I976_9ROSI|nr:hypothetical protein EZV62_006962 [Acer yangbiense]